MGRFVVATRDLEPGDVIIEEPIVDPVIIPPSFSQSSQGLPGDHSRPGGLGHHGFSAQECNKVLQGRGLQFSFSRVGKQITRKRIYEQQHMKKKK